MFRQDSCLPNSKNPFYSITGRQLLQVLLSVRSVRRKVSVSVVCCNVVLNNHSNILLISACQNLPVLCKSSFPAPEKRNFLCLFLVFRQILPFGCYGPKTSVLFLRKRCFVTSFFVLFLLQYIYRR